QPTYEGREIVLGPRTGDDYIIRSGLTAGDLVGTHGNLKIDSALQIQARPSMMTPDGGGRGGHQHDHRTPSAGGEQTPMTSRIDLPAEFFSQLRQVEASFEELLQSADETNLSRVHSSFKQLGEAVEGVDEELLRGH